MELLIPVQKLAICVEIDQGVFCSVERVADGRLVDADGDLDELPGTVQFFQRLSDGLDEGGSFVGSDEGLGVCCVRGDVV